MYPKESAILSYAAVIEKIQEISRISPSKLPKELYLCYVYTRE